MLCTYTKQFLVFLNVRCCFSFFRYEFTCVVQLLMDMDVKLLIELLGDENSTSFNKALNVYRNGYSSGSYAVLRIVNNTYNRKNIFQRKPNYQVGSNVSMGTSINGTNVTGSLLRRKSPKSTFLFVYYGKKSDQANNTIRCQVGGSPNPIFDGCTYHIRMPNGIFASYELTH